ncbi:hypothetical protein BDD12DRAFT_662096, partial [Trichophaea hybrida]
LLALFSEPFAKQFMSETTSWVDYVVLRILTAIVGAIRVGSPPFLKAIIGQVRENRALAEVELVGAYTHHLHMYGTDNLVQMSSTSHEVCELWNGKTIVHVMGTPQIELFDFLEG